MNLPPLGFGCSPFRSGGRRVDLEGAVRVAATTGYRLFDLAELYGNERAVGRALRSMDRSGLFLVGKVWRTNFWPENLRRACQDSLQRLGFDAFDLYLLHAPEAWRYTGPLGDPEVMSWEDFERRAVPRDAQGAPELDDIPLRETWEAMQELVRAGWVGAAGVSNFDPGQIQALGSPPPAANQIASSPFEPNAAIVADCQARGIALMAHSPLSAPGLLSAPPLLELAARLGRTPAQIVLRWNLQRGLTPLPSSTDPAHIAENLGALEFSLASEDMAAVDALAIDSAR